MINPFNAGDRKIAVSNLRGNHKAATVYCLKLVKHPGDVHYGWLECDEVVEGEFPLVGSSTLEFDDRIYYGELRIRGLYGIDELDLETTTESEAG